MAKNCRDIRARAWRLAMVALLAAAWAPAQARTPPPVRPPEGKPVRPAPAEAALADGVGLRKGLVLHMAFEGEGAKVKDLSGSNNGGALVGGRSVKEGKRGKGCYLDANGDYVRVANSPTIEIRSQLTVATWVKLASFNRRGYANEHGYIVNKGKDLWWNPAFYLGYSKSAKSNPALFHVCRHGAAQRGGGKTVASTTSIVPGKWTHLAGTYDGKQLKIYVNGTFEKAAAYTGLLRADRAPLLIGGGSLSGTGWGNQFTVNGTVDDVMVWNRALGAAEIRGLYHGTTDGGVYVERSTTADRITLRDGTVLTGTIGAKAYAATATFGKITLPAAAVAGFVRAAKTGEAVKFALLDGQVVVATPSDSTLRIMLADGRAQDVPLAKIASCGYRVTPGRPAIRAPAGPTVSLKNGSRLLLKAAPAKLQLETPYGDIVLPGTRVVRIDAVDKPAGNHRIKTAGGSTLSGTLAKAPLKLPLALGPDLAIRREDLLGLTTGVRPVKTGATVVATMNNGDQLRGTLVGKTLEIKTEFGNIAPALSAVRSISHDAATGTTTLTMRDGTIHHGTLAGKLVLSLGRGLSLHIPVAQMASITSVTSLAKVGIKAPALPAVKRLFHN